VYKVELIFFDAGGGHRSAANALRLVIDQQHQWETHLTNLQEIFDPIDILRKLTGVRLQDYYNLMLKKNWTLGARQLLPLLHGLIRIYHADQVRLLESHFRQSDPDLVVSLVPQFNRALCEGLRRTRPSAAFVTALTDLADYPPHFWMERQEQFFICGSDRAVDQARAIGIRKERIYKTSGMILHPRFYKRCDLDPRRERERLGLDPNLPTGLALFGGQGSDAMAAVARRLESSTPQTQLILICGHNERLGAALRKGPAHLRRLVLGYTTEVPYYMRLSDYFIGKPGPGSISEALFMKLPVIVERNARTLPQERYNAEWILEKQVGIVIPSFRLIGRAVQELLCPLNFTRYRANVAAMDNRAVFEVAEILGEMIRQR
jgi:1,2-diacylglycerol 3-beta-galactosyltransferase